MADNTEREAFEASMRGLYPSWSFAGDGCGGYHAHYTETAWQAWQARALAQGEPGEAQEPAAVLRVFPGKNDELRFTIEFGRAFTLPEGEHPLYLSPTASAPAAEREPLTDLEILQHLMLEPPHPSIWPHLKSEAIVGDVQKAVVAIARTVLGIGTKEPTNG